MTQWTNSCQTRLAVLETKDFSEVARPPAQGPPLIPGGCPHLCQGGRSVSRAAPGFIARGKGCHVWDLDGNEFIEYGMGLRAVTLGHAYEPVMEAAYQQMQLGTNFTRPAKIEVDLAEAMLEIIDGADMVKFAKNGSDVTTAAVKAGPRLHGTGHWSRSAAISRFFPSTTGSSAPRK